MWVRSEKVIISPKLKKNQSKISIIYTKIDIFEWLVLESLISYCQFAGGTRLFLSSRACGSRQVNECGRVGVVLFERATEAPLIRPIEHFQHRCTVRNRRARLQRKHPYPFLKYFFWIRYFQYRILRKSNPNFDMINNYYAWLEMPIFLKDIICDLKIDFLEYWEELQI